MNFFEGWGDGPCENLRIRRGAHGEGTSIRRVMGSGRTAFARTQAAAVPPSGAEAFGAAAGCNGHFVCAQKRHSLGDVAAGDGMWVWDDLLEEATGVAGGWGMAEGARGASGQTAGSRQDKLVAGGGGQRVSSCPFGGAKTGPNPTDRRKSGSKHHLITDAGGVPLASVLTSANTNDVTQLLPLVDAIPPIRGKPGRPRKRPDATQGDRAYDSQLHREELQKRGIKPILAKRGTKHGSGLGVHRWVVERTLSWLHQFRRLRIRYEKLPEIHEAFLSIGCALICWNCLQQL